jgi:uncharacterized protein (UPF0210 family)
LEKICEKAGFDWCTIGPVDLSTNRIDWAEAVVGAISGTASVFGAYFIANNTGILAGGIDNAARIIKTLASTTSGVSSNFRFAALAGCPPYVPLIPAAYGVGDGVDRFSLALDCTEMANQVLAQGSYTSISALKSSLNEALRSSIQRVQNISERLGRETGVAFVGIDTSFVPSPEPAGSVATIVERIIEPLRFGSSGTAFGTSQLADLLARLEVKHCGFSGIVYSIIEDTLLAQRNDEGLLSINGLLLYSTVGGIGLDLVPVAGSISLKELRLLLGNVAVISTRLQRPLIARLVPVSGKVAGESTQFRIPNLVNTKVLNHNV